MKKKTVRIDPDELDKVIHKFRKSLATITKEFSNEIWEIYQCIVQNNNDDKGNG